MQFRMQRSVEDNSYSKSRYAEPLTMEEVERVIDSIDMRHTSHPAQHTVERLHDLSLKLLAHLDANNLLLPTKFMSLVATVPGKRQVSTVLMHNRMGHRSVEALMLGHKEDMWNDVSLKPEPDSMCETCKITLSRKTKPWQETCR